MKKYNITFYYHTNVTVEVNAENEKEALKKAEIEVCKSKYDEQIFDGLQEDDAPDIVEIKNEENNYGYYVTSTNCFFIRAK